MASKMFVRKAVMGSLIVIIAAFVAFPAVAAQGEGKGPGPGHRPGHGNGPCAEDVAKFCKDVQPGGGRIMKCMKEHEHELSPGCKQHVAEMKEKAKDAKEACHDDVMKLCKDVQPGGGRIMKCLKEHEGELSTECRAKMESRKGPK